MAEAAAQLAPCYVANVASAPGGLNYMVGSAAAPAAAGGGMGPCHPMYGPCLDHLMGSMPLEHQQHHQQQSYGDPMLSGMTQGQRHPWMSPLGMNNTMWGPDSPLGTPSAAPGMPGGAFGLMQLPGGSPGAGIPYLVAKDLAEIKAAAAAVGLASNRPLSPSDLAALKPGHGGNGAPLVVTREAPESPVTPAVMDTRGGAGGHHGVSPLRPFGTLAAVPASLAIAMNHLRLGGDPRSDAGGSPSPAAGRGGSMSGAATPNSPWEELHKESRLWRWASPTAESIASGISGANSPVPCGSMGGADDMGYLLHRSGPGALSVALPPSQSPSPQPGQMHLHSKLVIRTTAGSPFDHNGAPASPLHRAATPEGGAMHAAARAYLMSHPAATPNYEIARTLKRHAEASSRPAASVRDSQLLMKLRASVVYPSLNKEDQLRSRAMWGLVIQLHSAGGAVPFQAAGGWSPGDSGCVGVFVGAVVGGGKGLDRVAGGCMMGALGGGQGLTG
jgi:hypothetical protein